LLREKLKAGKPTIGTHIQSTDPGILELMALTGVVDYIEFVGPYAPYDLYWLDTIARITELHNISSTLKVDQSIQEFQAQRAIASGIQGILFTDIRSVEDAKACVRAVRPDTPIAGGRMGARMYRDSRYYLDCASAGTVQGYNDVLVELMIEKRGAVDQLEQILSVEGIDMIQFGPADYSISTGVPGPGYGGKPNKSDERAAAAIKEVERKVIRTALERGVAVRVDLLGSETLEECREYVDMGVRHFCYGFEFVVIHRWLDENAPKLRALIK
jgi:2-keto-3-deoxy-L-rhamnonate aldolase RhmA